MKCIQVVGQGVPVRVSNEDAHQIVAVDRDGSYCPKHIWKQWYDRRGEVRRIITNIRRATR